MSKVCHLTSVHPPFDIRIFYKECLSLKKLGFEVSLIAPISTLILKGGINIIPINLPVSRFKRMLVVNQRMFRLALNTKSELYHFHDPELLLCGILLKVFGKKVIFDIHENVRLSLMSKSWIPRFVQPIVQLLYFLIERFSLLFFDALVLAEDSYLDYYPTRKSEVVLNYPLLKSIPKNVASDDNVIRFIYVGGVSENRGVWEMLHLIKYLDSKNVNCELTIVGQIYSDDLKNSLHEYIIRNKLDTIIRLVGRVDFLEIQKYLVAADIGLALLKPIANYKESLPTKIFEYMQHGLPLITNDFPLYKKYVENNKVGICVDINAIDKELGRMSDFVSNDPLLKNLGENGRIVINEKYNWESQEMKLVKLYHKILE